MTRDFWSGLVTCLLLGVSVASAAESDVLRERAGDLKKKAAVLMERGEKDAAQQLMLEATELDGRAQMLERQEKIERAKLQPEYRERELQRLHARLKELHAAHRELWASDAPEEELLDIRHRIRKIDALIVDKGVLTENTPEELLRLERQLQRIEHLRHAVEHLQAADMPDIAHHLREKSIQMEVEARERLERLEQQTTTLPVAPPPPAPAVEQSLRQEVEALRKELDALRKQRQP